MEKHLQCGFDIKAFKLTAHLGTTFSVIITNPTQFCKNDLLPLTVLLLYEEVLNIPVLV